MSAPDRPEWDDREFDIIMPFVVVKSKDGPFEDKDFVAGYQCGEISGKIETGRIAAGTFLVYSEVIPQIDRIAMRFNYRFAVLFDDGTWAQVGLTRID